MEEVTNMSNEQSWTADKGWSSSFGIKSRVNSKSPKQSYLLHQIPPWSFGCDQMLAICWLLWWRWWTFRPNKIGSFLVFVCPWDAVHAVELKYGIWRCKETCSWCFMTSRHILQSDVLPDVSCSAVGVKTWRGVAMIE